MHLSYLPGSSFNDGVNDNNFPLHNAIDSVMRLDRGALIAKIDIKSAFRLCPVHPSDHKPLGMKWRAHSTSTVSFLSVSGQQRPSSSIA